MKTATKKIRPAQCLKCAVYGYCNNNIVKANVKNDCRWAQTNATQALNIHMSINM